MVEQEAGGTSLSMDVMRVVVRYRKRGERERGGRGHEGSPHVAVEKTETEFHRTARPLKSESMQLPKKTTSDSNTCECLQPDSLPPSPSYTSIVLSRASANTRVIDADGC